jgi:hypothetical protein
LIIDIIDDRSLKAVNKYLEPFGIVYYKKKIGNTATVKTAEKGFSFWDRLMRVKPGFSRGDNEK